MSREPPPPTNQQLATVLQLARTQLVRTRQRLYALEASAMLAAAGRAPRLPMRFTSQYGEDLVLWDLFAGQAEGFYIEAGAFDGLAYSVTYPLEAAGWTGLLVEAIPDRARECVARRPGSRVVHAALGPRGSSGTAEFNVIDDQHGGMLSYLRPTPGQASAVAAMGTGRRGVSVPFTCLDDLLKDHSGPIDALVLDVEGNEVFVLQGFDMLRRRPRVVLLEDNTLGRGGVGDYMSTLPYVLAGWIEVNRVYIRADEAALIELARDALFTRV